MDIGLVLGGFAVGLVVGLTGMGGGALMTPMLVLFFGVNPLAAVSSDLVTTAIMKPFGGAVHAVRRTVNWHIVGWLALGSVPSGFLGVFLLRFLGAGSELDSVVTTALGVALLLAASALIMKAYVTMVRRQRRMADGFAEDDHQGRALVAVRPLPTLLVGVIGGLVVGTTSVGSGSLMIVALMLLYPRLQPGQLVGTDLVQAVPLVAAAALGHLLYGDFRLAITASLLLGSIPGTILGAAVSSRAPGGLIRSALALVLIASGLKLLGVPTPATVAVLVAGLLLGALVLTGARRRRGLTPSPGHVMAEKRSVPVWSPSVRELDDLEVLLLGGYAPVRGFLGPDDVAAVAQHGRLSDGTAWPVPITLVAPLEIAESALAAGALELSDEEGVPVAEVLVDQAWPVACGAGIAGEVRALFPLERGNHRALRRAASRTVPDGVERGPVLGVPVRCPIYAPELAALRGCAAALGARILFMPLIGHGTPQHVDRDGLVRACLSAHEQLTQHGCQADVIPVPVPRHNGGDEDERLLAALVARAYGATHVPGPLPAFDGLPIVVELPAVAHDLRTGSWEVADAVPVEHRGPWEAAEVPGLVRCAIASGAPVPPHLTTACIARELRRAVGATAQRGLTVLFSGLSGSGKSTIAKAVHGALLDRTERTVTLLDGDVVRRMLSAELTFSRLHRELNVRRIGFVAAEITRHGGIALCAPIAPHAAVRAEVRAMVEEHGDFRLVHVSTPLEVCESRDRKGLYAKARRGEIRQFTGISDPYEEPLDADLTIDTSHVSVEEAVELVMAAIAGCVMSAR